MKSTSLAFCASSLSSQTTERLLRLTELNVAEDPSANGGPQVRASSPCGFSILITSAPRSPRICPAAGAATLWPSSTTTIPLSGAALIALAQDSRFAQVFAHPGMDQ